MKFLPLLALLALTACGADGQPTAPQSGVTLSGDARVGVSTGTTP
ncbi:MAG: hypothetical protein U1A24_06410 [Cypionkella sp.]|nr:hypothetical protein [Cypionkella sp.]MDZ4310171.1 hypothetical protein [Cypionkella sp.]MDZ4395033.1 hypothetical protein [Cypionkella sp.]